MMLGHALDMQHDTLLSHLPVPLRERSTRLMRANAPESAPTRLASELRVKPSSTKCSDSEVRRRIRETHTLALGGQQASARWRDVALLVVQLRRPAGYAGGACSGFVSGVIEVILRAHCCRTERGKCDAVSSQGCDLVGLGGVWCVRSGRAR